MLHTFFVFMSHTELLWLLGIVYSLSPYSVQAFKIFSMTPQSRGYQNSCHVLPRVALPLSTLLRADSGDEACDNVVLSRVFVELSMSDKPYVFVTRKHSACQSMAATYSLKLCSRESGKSRIYRPISSRLMSASSLPTIESATFQICSMLSSAAEATNQGSF